MNTELKNLRKKIFDSNIPISAKGNLRLLTWNIRNFNNNKEDKAILYISEICKNFDIIAIQEVKDSLGGLEKLQKQLGKKYRFLFSDASGNSERLVFVYDSSKVQFTGLAAEVVMSPGSGRETVTPELEFDRTPYMASFRSNGCNFIIVTVHIYYGSGSAVQYRLEEIRNIAKYLKKSSSDTDKLDSDYIVCGDFNIEDVYTEMKKTSSKSKNILKSLFDALQSQGLIIEQDIQDSPSNLSKTKHFDQIGYHKYPDSTIKFVKGGVIDFMGAVYINDPKIKFKLTDHLPMWAVFSTSPDKNPKYINP
ncbi:endonuclease/exonuclease/phosphatase family protein [Nitrosarchaeum sp. AC2]|uniref:endonuclease/exonuclease/phosphatase family protein n=1 Tax=Nitrosarchaeum sp. AC2 TaxID=2259673 RepID=UPI0015C99407|nr:endonuclease/exonuclease/phosphatase family protein [Nitrosarchaeum sp. AC2]